MRLTIRPFLVLVLVSLAGCHTMRDDECHKPQAYQSATTVAGLRAPEGIPPANTKNGIKVPDLGAVAKPRGPKDPCLDVPPPFLTEAAPTAH